MSQLRWWPSGLRKILRQLETREGNPSNKTQNNIPYHEAWKIVIGSKTPAYYHVAQRGKAPHKKYEEIMKTLIQLETGDWESFINEKASLELEKMTPPELHKHHPSKHRPPWRKSIRWRKQLSHRPHDW